LIEKLALCYFFFFALAVSVVVGGGSLDLAESQTRSLALQNKYTTIIFITSRGMAQNKGCSVRLNR
jgi:hypothetical protein